MLPGASLECLQIDAWTSPIVPELMFMAGMTLIRHKAATDREKRRRPKWRVCFELCSPAPVITIVWANSWCRRVRRSSLLKQAHSINPKAKFILFSCVVSGVILWRKRKNLLCLTCQFRKVMTDLRTIHLHSPVMLRLVDDDDESGQSLQVCRTCWQRISKHASKGFNFL